MDWSKISTWPNANLSRRIVGPRHRWHVQETGSGDVMLLLHGAGGSTHSLRDLIGPLARQYRVVAIDLPGHGFTQLGARHRSGLDAMTEDILALLAAESWTPHAIVGHSAGGAIALNLALALQDQGQLRHVIGLNPALAEFEGVAGFLFPVMAKLLALTPFTASIFSQTAANPDRIKRLIESTGSQISPDGLALYQSLVGDRAHVDGALQMMAQWNLKPLHKRMHQLAVPVTFATGLRDLAVPPDTVRAAAEKLPSAHLIEIEKAGHLMHEEDPQQTMQIIMDALK